MNKQSTKICPKCGCADMSLLHGEDKKLCTGCGHEIEWPLDEGQKSLFKPNVVGTSDGALYDLAPKSPESQVAYKEAIDRVLAIGRAADLATASLEKIHAILNGTEWDSSTCSAIADVLHDAGYQVAQP